ncbi:hypothetical protein GEV39_12550 [Pseudomonas sp. NY5710]|nr:hypothetical protein GEV39_12550 [Pseudomonas sp. NY5710]
MPGEDNRNRAVACGEMVLAIAVGVESMSRAPFVMGKAEAGRPARLGHDVRWGRPGPGAGL